MKTETKIRFIMGNLASLEDFMRHMAETHTSVKIFIEKIESNRIALKEIADDLRESSKLDVPEVKL